MVIVLYYVRLQSSLVVSIELIVFAASTGSLMTFKSEEALPCTDPLIPGYIQPRPQQLQSLVSRPVNCSHTRSTDAASSGSRRYYSRDSFSTSANYTLTLPAICLMSTAQ